MWYIRGQTILIKNGQFERDFSGKLGITHETNFTQKTLPSSRVFDKKVRKMQKNTQNLTKKCSKCQKIKNLSNFRHYKNRYGKSCYYSLCKDCRLLYDEKKLTSITEETTSTNSIGLVEYIKDQALCSRKNYQKGFREGVERGYLKQVITLTFFLFSMLLLFLLSILILMRGGWL